MHRGANQGMMNMLNQHQQPNFHQSQYQQGMMQQGMQQPQQGTFNMNQLPQILQKHFEHIQTLYSNDQQLQNTINELKNQLNAVSAGRTYTAPQANSQQQQSSVSVTSSRDYRSPNQTNDQQNYDRYSPVQETQEKEVTMETPTYNPEEAVKESGGIMLTPISHETCPEAMDFNNQTLDVSGLIKELDSLTFSEDFGGIDLSTILGENEENFSGYFGEFGIIHPHSYLSTEIIKEDLMSSPEAIAAVLRRLVRTAESVDDIAFLRGVNNTLTIKLNEFMYTNYLPVLINNFMDEYDDILSNMKQYVKPEVYTDFYDSFNLVVTRAVRETYRNASKNELEVEGKLPLYFLADVLYLDTYSFMLGLDNSEIGYDTFTQLDETTGLNKQLVPYIKNVGRKAVNAKRPVYLVTKDGKIFKFTYGNLGVFVTKVDSVF